jgi:hypothetical protein
VLKGLKTLSRSPYSPPAPTDFVLIDYGDSATFDAGAGYYHPKMRTVDGRTIPSSDELLHEFLRQTKWAVDASDELTLLRKQTQAKGSPVIGAAGIANITASSTLLAINKSGSELTKQGIEIDMIWDFREPRDIFPWMFLRLTSLDHGKQFIIPRGLSAPEAVDGQYDEKWRITPYLDIAEGDYDAEAIFVDNTKRAWANRGTVNLESAVLSSPISFGRIRVSSESNRPSRN